jgi:hypothetical protein
VLASWQHPSTIDHTEPQDVHGASAASVSKPNGSLKQSGIVAVEKGEPKFQHHSTKKLYLNRPSASLAVADLRPYRAPRFRGASTAPISSTRPTSRVQHTTFCQLAIESLAGKPKSCLLIAPITVVVVGHARLYPMTTEEEDQQH